MARAETQKHDLESLPSPAELAEELCHLPGMVFLDSSSSDGSVDGSGQARYSLITACPSRILKGNIFKEESRERLRTALTDHQRPETSTPDLGFPTAGLYGSVDYEGDFVFGEYHEYLVYDHKKEEWQEEGSLSTKRKEASFRKLEGALPFTGHTSEKEFCEMVATAQEYIAAGDIYQVNLSHKFTASLPTEFSAFLLHQRLRDRSPAPFAAYVALDDKVIVSSSPEQFLSISGRTIQTRPIKGTRPRFRDRERDEKSAYDLITSPKEVAELIMITDLERNDLGQICEYGSVEATELLKLERYAQVFHLVSTVEGRLRQEVDHISALHACFPGGSITGAPKKRAREIIEELEPVPRGVYTGAIGCLGFNGESRFNIAIRTAIVENNELHFHVGAGIVADSIPEKEWEETLHKAAGIFQACESFEDN